ncbi:MAG: hypothetical protein AAF203_07950, partial [Pseudomonadota bacterium]
AFDMISIVSQRYTSLVFFFCFLFASLAQGEDRFDFQKNGQGQWEASTFLNRGEALGQLLRELGVEPNWSDRIWVRGISQANPGLIDSKGQILFAGRTLVIPIDSLSSCLGYPELISRLEQREAPPAPIVVQQEPVVEPTPAPPSPPQEPSEPTKLSFVVRGGAGIAQLYGEEESGITTDLTTDYAGYLDLRLLLHWNSTFDLSLYGRGSSLFLPEITNITSNLEKELYFSGGAGFRFRWGEGFHLGLFGEFRETPRADFNIVTLDIIAAPVVVAGMSFDIRFLSWQESGLFLRLRPQALFPSEKDNVSLQNGFGSQVQLEWAPKVFRDQSGWIVGGEYLFEGQSAEHLLLNDSDQFTHQFYGYLGYVF